MKTSLFLAMALAAMTAGCTDGAEDSEPTGTVEVIIPNAEELVGATMSISRDDATIDSPYASTTIDSRGHAILPVHGPGTYFVKAEKIDPADPDCMTGVWKFFDHPGQGLIQVTTRRDRICE